MSDLRLQSALSMPAEFRFDEVPAVAEPAAAATPAPSLGALAAFAGTFHGKGFNTIFRPDSSNTPTRLPAAVSGSDNVLELNLTKETLSFSPSLGAVPNRGEVQADINLNGISYLQVINDVTTGQSVGIHVEPGLWMAVPATTDPGEGAMFVRMAAIPHGTTLLAQGKATTIAGKPTFPVIGITPFFVGQPNAPQSFDGQTAAQGGTARISQDLASFIKAGTITQALLDNPTSLLSSHIASLDVTSATSITVSTAPPAPLFGGGLSNIAFLLGDTHASSPNAQAVSMESTFYIETVEYTLQVPVFEPGHPPLTITPETGSGEPPVPEFQVIPPDAITAPRTVKATATQIQYVQKVLLNFNGLSWPHVSVATLVPAAPVAVPASAFS